MNKIVFTIGFALAFSIGRESEAKDFEAQVFDAIWNRPASRYDKEPESERLERVRVAARAITKASRSPSDARVLLTLGKFESAWARYVADGCDKWPRGAPTCDGGKSRSYWQMKEFACREGWRFERGDPQSVEVFARCAIRVFRRAERRCRGKHAHSTLAGGFAGYRSWDCSWAPAAKRADWYWVAL